MSEKSNSRIIDDVSPRMREIIDNWKPPTYSNKGLDRDREPFTEKEREIANRIGTPQQGQSEKK